MQTEAKTPPGSSTGGTQQKLEVMGASVFVHEEGQGLPVLLLHGSPDTHDMWRPLMAHLADHVRCLAPDLPGFGQSTLPRRFSLALDNMADFVRELLRALNIDEPVALVTTDFGGWEDKLLALLQEKPAIVLWGDRDPFIDPAYADRFVGAEAHHFERYSHWLPLEAPADYAEVLLPWLQSL